MSGRSPKVILADLDKALSETKWCGPPSDISHLNDPEHLAKFKELGNFEQVISNWVVGKVKELIRVSGQNEFSICSVGCEDGALDLIILQELSKALPVEKFKYTGINVDEQVCEIAEETLQDVGPNIDVELLVRDYEELTEDGLQPFDLILMANCTYHASSLEPMLTGATRLLKPKTGELVIISSSRQSFEELITCFWFHQRKHELNTAEMVTAALDKLGIKYSVSQETVTFDLTEQFGDRFESDSSVLTLDHLVFTRLHDYPPQVASLCVEFLEALSMTNDSVKVVTSVSDLIVVQGN